MYECQRKDELRVYLDLAKEKELLASAQEKFAKMDVDRASSEHIRAEADLKLVKLAMELEDVQFNQIREAFELAQAIKAANSGEQAQVI